MAISYYWRGGAPAVQQESRATPANVEIGDVFTLKVGGVTIATFTATAGTVANVTAGLVAAWALSAHPYATAMAVSDQTTYVKILANEAGVPFTVTSTATNVGGGVDNQTLTITTPVVNAGPSVYSTLANWIDAATNAPPTALPGSASNDKVIFDDGAISCLWDLDQSAISNALAEFRVMQTFTGKIGLDYTRFATSADGEQYAADGYGEYRQKDLKIKVAVASANGGGVIIGQHDGPGNPAGAPRICLDTTTTAATIVVYKTAAQSSDAGRPVLRLLCNSTSSSLSVMGGSVGLAVDRPGEVSTIDSIRLATGSLYTGPGVTLSGSASPNYQQFSGSAVLNFAADPGEIYVSGGVCRLQGNYAVNQMSAYGGTLYPNSRAPSGASFAAILMGGAVVDFLENPKDALITLIVWGERGTLISHDLVTISATIMPPVNAQGIAYSMESKRIN